MKRLYHPKLPLYLSAIFFLVGMVFWFLSSSEEKSQDTYYDYVTKRLHRQLLVSKGELEAVEDYRRIEELTFSYPTFLFEGDLLTHWTDHRISLSYQDITSIETMKYLHLQSGKYLCQVQKTDNEILVQLIWLESTPTLFNQYVLRGYNEKIFPPAIIGLDVSGSEELDIHGPEGEELFGVSFDHGIKMAFPKLQLTQAAAFLLALMLLLVYFVLQVWTLAKKGKVVVALISLLVGLIFLWSLMIHFRFPFSIYPFEVFNPLNYVSSFYDFSLGDLLVSMIFLLIISTFLMIFLPGRKPRRNSGISFQVLGFLGFFSLSALALGYGVIEDILVNSQIELDINASLTLNSLRVVSIITFLSAILLWFQVTHIFYKYAEGINRKKVGMSFLAACIGYILWAWLIGWEILLIIGLQASYVALLFFLRLPDLLTDFRYSSLFYFFTASVIGSLIGSMAIYENYEYEELIEKQRFSNDLFIENDLRGEYLMHEASKAIREDIFIQTRMLNPQFSINQIEQKIKRDYLGGYFDKYDLNVHLYDSEGMPFDTNSPDSLLNDIRVRYRSQPQYQTGYDSIFFISNQGSDQPKKYLLLIPISRYDNLIGYLIIDFRLKKVIPHAVFPELLTDSRFVENNRSFDYAFYDKNILNYKAGVFNYEGMFDLTYFSNPKLYSRGIEKRGYHHLGIRGEDNRTLIITSSVYPFTFLVSNFSFLFIASVLSVLSLIVVRLLAIDTHLLKLNFTSKIQLYLNLAFFLPLVATSIVVINTLNTSYKEEIDRSSIKKANTLKDHLVGHLDSYLRNQINREALSTEIANIARYSQSDLNLYDIEGKLISSSQPQIFTSNLLSTRINQKALQAVIEEDRDDIVLSESVGSLVYKTTYAAIKSFDSGELLGIVGIPFFSSKNHLQRQNIETFTNILNIFTLVLIASLFVSHVSSRLLTHPLNLLTQKIRKTSLSEHNEPLQWEGGDEIGTVVNEYNKMLVNLEESKEALAKSQKESAWREIAQQVAHEIKNPLTPMKLSLQHLKRVLSKENGKGLAYEKPIDNLLHQVDSLSDIASSFSAFAKMPMPENERFAFSSEVRRMVELFSNEEVDIELHIEEEELYVNGDQKLMGRIISNLIINGIQSVPDRTRPQLRIKLSSTRTKLLLEVRDNGAGIAEEIQSKVFVPNFSTKDQGSGIGLAIAKRGIDHAGGNIWFETSNQGTSFFVDLPLADSK